MLVLTRKQNEKIKIGENITVTVLRMKGKGVRLGIQAPNDMSVLRGELVFDIEDDTLVQDPSQDDTVLESTVAPKVGGRVPMASHRFSPSQEWSSESSQESERSPLKTQSANSQLTWSI